MKSSLLVLAGLLGVGAVAGGTASMLQKAPTVPPLTAIPSPQSPGPEVVAPPDRPVALAPTVMTERPATAQPSPTRLNPDDRANATVTAERQVTQCKISMAIVKDDNPPLNVRSRPGMDGTIVGQLKDGSFVSVEREQDGWFKIVEPAGWIAKTKTASRCGQKVEQVSFRPGSTGAQLADEFLGSGSHKYRLSLAQGQTLRVRGTVGPMPAVIAPDGKYLVGLDEARGDWSIVLPRSGEYTFEMDSNFRGYKYEFSVDVR